MMTETQILLSYHEALRKARANGATPPYRWRCPYGLGSPFDVNAWVVVDANTPEEAWQKTKDFISWRLTAGQQPQGVITWGAGR